MVQGHALQRASRRRFVRGAGVAALGLLAACGQPPWQARPPVRVPRVGFLTIGPDDSHSPPAPGSPLSYFRDGLIDHGYVENQNVVVEWRRTNRGEARLSELAAELAALPVDVLVTGGPGAAEAARDATSTVPVVFLAVGDPVGLGYVESVGRPDKNLTGVANSPVGSLVGKQLELLQATVPGLTRLGWLRDAALPSSAVPPSRTSALSTAAQALALELQFLDVRSPADFEGAFETAVRGQAHALFNTGTPLLGLHNSRIAELALAHHLPAMGQFGDFPRAGGLISYGVSLPAVFRRGAAYVDKILKGAKPADLPVEQPMTFDFAINLKTADALGLTIPRHVLLQATEIIQ